MAIPATPTNFILQQGNTQVLLSWDIMANALTYPVQRSTDGVTFSALSTPATNFFLDTTAVIGTKYFYQVSGHGSTGDSVFTTPQSVVPTNTAVNSLGQVRLEAQQRADRVGSNFVTIPEWNRYIVQSYFELYDLLVTLFEDYFVKAPLIITTDGVKNQFTLPLDFFKLMGVDLGLDANSQAWVTLGKFNFHARNRYVFPQITTSYLGRYNLNYRLVGNTLMFIPTPGAGQFIRIWYIPRLTEPLLDTDMLDGVSGWTEYVITDAAIKAMQKEESDCSVLQMQKNALIKRIEESAMNRDAGQPDAISDSRGNHGGSNYGSPGGDGGYGGY